VHHTGKSNAREHTVDQYSGRGGSALADGSRMTTVLAPWHESMDLVPTLPEHIDTDAGQLLVLVRAKLSYSPPDLPPILVMRKGFGYVHEEYTAPEGGQQAVLEQRIWRALLAAYKKGARMSMDAWAKRLASGLVDGVKVRSARMAADLLSEMFARGQFTLGPDGIFVPVGGSDAHSS
jgi:hypothetical protein